MGRERKLSSSPESPPPPFFPDILARPDQTLHEHLWEVYQTGAKILAGMSLNPDPEHQLTGEILTIFRRNVHLALLLHDVGKASSHFQAYLENESHDQELKKHSRISALFVAATTWVLDGRDRQAENPQRRFMGYLAQLAVLSHHTRMHDLNAIQREPQRKTLPRILSDLLQHSDFIRDYLRHHVLAEICPTIPQEEREGLCGKILAQVDTCSQTIETDYYYAYDEFLSGVSDLDEVFVEKAFYLGKLAYSILLEADKMSAARLGTGGVPAEFSRQDLGKQIKNFMINAHPEPYLIPGEFPAEHPAEITLAKENFPTPVEINLLRRKIRHNVLTRLEPARGQPNIYTLQVPTGLGKTLSVLSAGSRVPEGIPREVPSPRVVYGLPYLSIITQVVDQLLDVLPEDRQDEDVLLAHHHLTPSKYRDTSDEEYDLAQADLLVSSWHSEYVVTSFHQILNACFKAHYRPAQKFNKLASTVVVFDEIQVVPLRYWKVVNSLLRILRDLFNTSSFVMSATLPKIVEETTRAVNLSANLGGVHDVNRISIEFHLNTPIIPETFAQNACEIIAKNPRASVLLVANTRREAQEIHEHIAGNKAVKKQDRPVKFLSASLIPHSKREVIEEIKELLKSAREVNAPPPVLVSTQCVEAGVDVDFDYVLRDFAPLDSIIQVAGRCNRNGGLSRGQVHVYEVVDAENNRMPFSKYIYDENLLNKTRQAIGPAGDRDRPIAEPEIHALVTKYYEDIDYFFGAGEIEKQQQTMLDHIHQFRYKKLAEDFQLIENLDAVAFFVNCTREARHIWQRLIAAYDIAPGVEVDFAERREASRRAQEYVVSAYLRTEEINQLGTPALGGLYLIDTDQPDQFITYDTKLGIRINRGE